MDDFQAKKTPLKRSQRLQPGPPSIITIRDYFHDVDKSIKYMTNITPLSYKGKFVELNRYDTMT